MSDLMPVIFVGHGSPMNAVEENAFTKKWKLLAQEIPKPKAILCISAHWLREGTAVTAMDLPKTIYDFYGFPAELYEIKYPARGDPALAKKVKKIVKTTGVELDSSWGLDHGTWSVLKNMYPSADVPVIQLSLDYQLAPQKIFDIGKELSVLRKEGVLIVGSGNLVHNLMMMNPHAKPFKWAQSFYSELKTDLEKTNYSKVVNYAKYKDFMSAHPTNDHYLPLIYVIGAASEDGAPQFFSEEISFASISMACLAFGLKKKLAFS